MTDDMIGEVYNPDSIDKVDIVVGIPSYKEADNIAFPVEQAAIGLEQYFSDKKAVIINCDNSSPGNCRWRGFLILAIRWLLTNEKAACSCKFFI